MAISWIVSVLMVALSLTYYECHPRGRILGGQDSKPETRPYMVSVQLDGVHECGGLLISDKWVLSAAHCATNKPNLTLHVVLGAYSITREEKYKIDIPVLKEIPHPLFNSTTKYNDILLLELPVNVTLNPAVKPLAFQTDDTDIPENTQCLVSGWGQMKQTGKKADILQDVLVPVISRDLCNRRDYYDDEITVNMMCAGEKGKDSCEGDSGGPLLCNGVAVAIVQGGFRQCGKPKKPGIYTRIAPYKSWIINTMHNATLYSNKTTTLLP
ncbi:hypothetical protein GDO86_001022 [Hymenochirus boettgeri]|uniref:Peptidase S1 domain-containing protein n=1 Tax=Hymenochirus boettgeri TaxID=247094 RepID=A0A8T2KFI8_9PIPI|nr:hypothetical protein GDO86_001022 [Hymenochirus boettgeri]